MASADFVQPDKAAIAALDNTIENYLDENTIAGALVAVARDGQLVYVKAHGLANVELSVPVTPESVFEIGSISKQFVAAAAMLLVEEGRLDLDKSIHGHLPELPGEWLGVTMRQLLTHTSGIPDYEEIESYEVYRDRLTPNDIIRSAHSRPMDFTPGTGWYYSNTGYFLASMVLERIEGKPIGEVLRTRIFGPLEMDETRFTDPEAIIPKRVSGYWSNKNGELINRRPTETSSTLGAGGLLTSAGDLALWDRALNDDSLLSESSRSEMWAAVEADIPWSDLDGYGFGWELGEYLGLNVQQHYGQVAGFNAQFMRVPELGFSIIVLTNLYLIDTTPMTRAVLHAVVPSLGPVPTE